MKPRLLVVFLASLVALGIVIWHISDRARLEAELAKSRLEIAEWRAIGTSLRILPSDPSQQSPLIATRIAPVEPAAPSFVNLRLIQKKLMDDPAAYAASFNAAILQIEVQYGRFFAQLEDWPPERKERLKQLMAANGLNLSQVLVPEKIPPTEVDLKAMNDAQTRILDENTKRMRDALGEKDFAKFDAFAHERSSRESIGVIADVMRSRGLVVSEELEHSILSKYTTALREAAAEASKVDPRTLTTTERAELSRGQHEAFRLKLLQQMSGVLDEKQLNAFLESQSELQNSTVSVLP